MKRLLNAYFKVDSVTLFQPKYLFVFRVECKDANKITPPKKIKKKNRGKDNISALRNLVSLKL